MLGTGGAGSAMFPTGNSPCGLGGNGCGGGAGGGGGGGIGGSPSGIGIPLGTGGAWAPLGIGLAVGVGVLLSQDKTGPSDSDNPWAKLLAGGAAQPPDDDDDDDDDDQESRIAKAIARHADESSARPGGGGTHYVSGVRPDQLHVYVKEMIGRRVPNLEVRYLRHGRVAYWDPAKKAVVIEDGKGGTVFTPRDGYQGFKDLP